MKPCAILLLAVAALATVPLFEARADDPAPGAGVWVFDVRVVRVDMADVNGTEAPVPWQDEPGAVTAKPYPEMLAVLKKRGTALVMLDQRVTALAGREAGISQDTLRPSMVLASTTGENTVRRSTLQGSGCTAALTADTSLRYKVRARWSGVAPAESEESAGTPEFSVSWDGSAPIGGGGTLVLHYREQRETDEAVKACEVYCFLAARRTP